jgi:hypothetical protein
MLWGFPADAAPKLTWMLPSGGQRGGTVKISVNGTGMDELTGVFAASPGLSARVLPADPGQDAKTARTIEVHVAPDAPLGKNELRVFDATGVSNTKYFWVGQFPEAAETEPNDGRSQAGEITLPTTINGQIGKGGDIDSYRFEARKGQEISIEIQSLRLLGELGDSWLKGYAWVEDSLGRTLVENDGYYRWDPYLQFTVPEDGKYTISYRDIQYRGNPMGVYRLTVGAVPHVWSTYPLGGQPGTRYPVQLRGCNLGSTASTTLEIPADAPEGLRTVWFDVDGVSTNQQRVAVSPYPQALEQEPNDRPAVATPVPFPSAAQGILERPGDVDCFRFTARKGQQIALEVVSDRADLPLDSVLTLRRADGGMVTENDDLGGQRDGRGVRDSRIVRTIDADGEYVAQVRDVDLRGGPDYVYQLSLSPVRPGFALQFAADRAALKAGGELTLPVNLLRTDGFGGEVRLIVEGLPDGAECMPAVIPKGQNSAQLKLRCPAGVAARVLLLRVWGEAEIDGQAERRLATTQETYNIQGTAYRRDLTGPVIAIIP